MFADTGRACRLPVCGEPQKHQGLPVLVLIARCRTGSPWHRLTPGGWTLESYNLARTSVVSLFLPRGCCKWFFSCLVEAVERVEQDDQGTCAMVGVATR